MATSTSQGTWGKGSRWWWLLSCIVNGVLLLIRSAVCDIDYAVFTSPQYSAPRLCLVSLKFMSSCGRPAESIAVSFSVSFCRPTFFFIFGNFLCSFAGVDCCVQPLRPRHVQSVTITACWSVTFILAAGCKEDRGNLRGKLRKPRENVLGVCWSLTLDSLQFPSWTRPVLPNAEETRPRLLCRWCL